MAVHARARDVGTPLLPPEPAALASPRHRHSRKARLAARGRLSARRDGSPPPRAPTWRAGRKGLVLGSHLRLLALSSHLSFSSLYKTIFSKKRGNAG